MAIIYVYDIAKNTVERFTRGLNETMPYATPGTLSVREFRGSSCSDIFWTNLQAIRAWNETRAVYGRPIPVYFVFKRIWEGGHGMQSQHYAGGAFDVGQGLSQPAREAIHYAARSTGAWSYVEPLHLTPTWVHMDYRQGPPACPAGGYPLIRLGSRGTYVFVMQDALNALGYTGSGLDGIFGQGSVGALRRFQADYGLVADGICGCMSWNALTSQAVGIGQTGSVVGKCY